jgi:hypothetical protein
MAGAVCAHTSAPIKSAVPIAKVIKSRLRIVIPPQDLRFFPNLKTLIAAVYSKSRVGKNSIG